MKYTGMSRPVDDLGRVVIPKEIRNTLNLKTKDLLEIYIEGDMIVLKKNENKCVLCSGTDSLLPYNGKLVCKTCAESLKNMLI